MKSANVRWQAESESGGDGNDGGEELIASDPRERSPLFLKGAQGRWLHVRNPLSFLFIIS